MMGLEEGAKRGLFSVRFQAKDKFNVFTLGDRFQILQTVDPGLIMLQVPQKYPFEAIFKSVTHLLLDNASSEYIFNGEFFGQNSAHENSETSAAAFNGVFEATFKTLQNLVKQHVDNTFDAVGLLICIRINAQNLRIMQRRVIPCLDTFLNNMNMILWPRYQALIDLHIDSLKKANVSKMLTVKEPHPHYVVRRYADFSISISTLNQGYDDAILVNRFNFLIFSLGRLRAELLNFVGRMALEFGSNTIELIFWINNIDLVLSALMEHEGDSFDAEKTFFQSLSDSKIEEFVHGQLQVHIGKMMKFVVDTETANLSLTDAHVFEAISSDFNNNWKTHISTVTQSIPAYFPNFENGARIMHTALGQLVMFYKRFIALWERKFGNRAGRTQPVGLQNVLVEIKKFKSNF